MKGTVNFGIMYTDNCDVKLTGYSDSYWAGNPDERKSTSGYEFSIGNGHSDVVFYLKEII